MTTTATAAVMTATCQLPVWRSIRKPAPHIAKEGTKIAAGSDEYGLWGIGRKRRASQSTTKPMTTMPANIGTPRKTALYSRAAASLSTDTV